MCVLIYKEASEAVVWEVASSGRREEAGRG